MPTHEASTSGVSPMFRIVGIGILFLSVSACGLQVLAALSAMTPTDPPSTTVPPPVVALFTPALLTLIAGIGLAAILEGIARLVGNGNNQPVAQDSTAIVKAMMTIGELQNSLPKSIADAIQQSSASPSVEISHVGGLDPNVELHLERVVSLLEDINELSQRRAQPRKNAEQPIVQDGKALRLQEVTGLIDEGNWAQADALLNLLESLHPGDAEILATRNHLEDSRIISQAEDWEKLIPHVESLLAESNFAQAQAAATQFLGKFPAHADGLQLALQIKQRELIFLEAGSNRVYDEIRVAVEARQWRKALASIQQFLNAYPDHPRSTKIRQQVRVVQKNAEIEERHEQEERVRQLVNARQYSEAADLSQELLTRFPDSPQVGYLSDLLPKLRERSAVEARGEMAEEFTS